MSKNGISYDEFEYRTRFYSIKLFRQKFLPNKTKITKAKDLNYTELDEYHKIARITIRSKTQPT